MGDQPVASLPKQDNTNKKKNAGRQRTMPRRRFEPMIPDFRQPETIRALDRAAPVSGK
jgi:hypothetical protein